MRFALNSAYRRKSRKAFAYYVHFSVNLLLIIAVLGVEGCQFDDDQAYEIRTYASFFQVQSGSGGYSICRLSEGKLEHSWNQRAGILDVEVSDAAMIDNRLWISSAIRKSIFKLSPETAVKQETFQNLPLAPHYFSVGEKQVLLSDTTDGKLAFLRLRDGELQEIPFQGKPGICIYNAGKFYLELDHSSIVIYDESTLSPRSTIVFDLDIDDIQLDSFRVVNVFGHDSIQFYKALVTGNGDYLVAPPTPTRFSKIRLSPYFSKSFGSEFRGDIGLDGVEIVHRAGEVLVDSADNFEVDFFEGTLFYTIRSTLFRFDLRERSLKDSFSFGGVLHNSFHQYSTE
jgi:hypothetical protein